MDKQGDSKDKQLISLTYLFLLWMWYALLFAAFALILIKNSVVVMVLYACERAGNGFWNLHSASNGSINSTPQTHAGQRVGWQTQRNWEEKKKEVRKLYPPLMLL